MDQKSRCAMVRLRYLVASAFEEDFKRKMLLTTDTQFYDLLIANLEALVHASTGPSEENGYGALRKGVGSIRTPE